MTKKLSFNGTQLKVYAIAAMLIDHIGLVILGVLAMPLIKGVGNTAGFFNADIFGKFIIVSHYICRAIGRTSFPIFCFLIAEGVKHTSNRLKYFLRLFVFAFISEIPYDLAIYKRVFYFDKQNVFFTLAAGVLIICIVEWIYKKAKSSKQKFLSIVICIAVTVLFLYLIKLLRTDYSYNGVLLVLMLYLFRDNKPFSVLSGAMLLGDKRALLSFVPIYFYNGERGKCPTVLKYGFYAFYPIHLIILYLIYIVVF